MNKLSFKVYLNCLKKHQTLGYVRAKQTLESK